MGKSNATFESVKLFNVKNHGKITRFAIGINGKKQDGSYTKNAFLNCVSFEPVSEGQLYTLNGYFSANEYQDKVTLEFVVQTAIAQGIPQSKPKVQMPPTDDFEDSIPF